MKVYASMSDHLPLAEVPSYVRRVEALGYDGIHVAETVHDVFLTALLAIQSSQRLEVRTAVALAFPRSPMVTALAAWDLARLSEGRFSLGLGTQVKGNIEGRYATTWSDPVGRMADYVTSLRTIFARFQDGGSLEHQGLHYRFTRLQPYFNPGPHDQPDVPILLGGVGAEMVTLAGAVADGLVTHPTSSLPEALELLRSRLRIGEQSAGRRSTPLIASTQFATGATGRAVAADRERKRHQLAFLYATPAYREALVLVGEGERADALHALSREGRWEDLPALLDDALLDRLCPAAPFADLAELLLERYAGRADALVVSPPEDANDDPALRAVLDQVRQAGSAGVR